MLYPQNGNSFVTIDSVMSLHHMYREREEEKAGGVMEGGKGSKGDQPHIDF